MDISKYTWIEVAIITQIKSPSVAQVFFLVANIDKLQDFYGFLVLLIRPFEMYNSG